MRSALLFLVACAATPAMSAERIETGRLEVLWGDAIPDPTGTPRSPHQLRVTFLDERGKRWALDPQQAQRAAGDLAGLAGKRVGVALTPDRQGRPARVSAIVPAQVGPDLHVISNQPNAMKADILGTTRWITLACKFNDIATEHKPIAFFDSQYGDAEGQLGHYWRTMSRGRVSLAGSASHGWFTLPQPRSAYFFEGGKADLGKLFTDCTAAAEPTVDFRGAQGVNLMFNADLDGFAWGGKRCATLDGENTCWSSTWNPPWAYRDLAPLAHEMGHGYGLPHSNNSDGDSDTYDNPWDNMSDSWRWSVEDGTFGDRPKSINQFQRNRLGWLDTDKILDVASAAGWSGYVQLDWSDQAGAGRQMVILRLPTPADPYATTLYTLEARANRGAYDADLPGGAVIIHKILSSRAHSVDLDVPPANFSGNEGSMFKPGERWNTPEQTHWVTIVSQNAQGFVVWISSDPPHVTGGNLPARVR